MKTMDVGEYRVVQYLTSASVAHDLLKALRATYPECFGLVHDENGYRIFMTAAPVPTADRMTRIQYWALGFMFAHEQDKY
jgi:hypothetical protein